MIFDMKITMTEEGPTPRRLLASFNRAKKAAMFKVAEHHHRRNIPKHFTMRAIGEYGYTPRTRLYAARKWKEMRTRLPLVHTGESRVRVLRRDIRGTHGGARLVLHAPALNLRPKDDSINLREELTAMTETEVNELVAVAKESMIRQFASIRTKTRVRIR